MLGIDLINVNATNKNSIYTMLFKTSGFANIEFPTNEPCNEEGKSLAVNICVASFKIGTKIKKKFKPNMTPYAPKIALIKPSFHLANLAPSSKAMVETKPGITIK